MTKSLRPSKGYYTELETADHLKISLARLHALLDEHIFTTGIPRPQGLTFCEADLILLEFWMRSAENPKVLRMPKRN
jgi:hypothetical protein